MHMHIIPEFNFLAICVILYGSLCIASMVPHLCAQLISQSPSATTCHNDEDGDNLLPSIIIVCNFPASHLPLHPNKKTTRGGGAWAAPAAVSPSDTQERKFE